MLKNNFYRIFLCLAFGTTSYSSLQNSSENSLKNKSEEKVKTESDQKQENNIIIKATNKEGVSAAGVVVKIDKDEKITYIIFKTAEFKNLGSEAVTLSIGNENHLISQENILTDKVLGFTLVKQKFNNLPANIDQLKFSTNIYKIGDKISAFINNQEYEGIVAGTAIHTEYRHQYSSEKTNTQEVKITQNTAYFKTDLPQNNDQWIFDNKGYLIGLKDNFKGKSGTIITSQTIFEAAKKLIERCKIKKPDLKTEQKRFDIGFEIDNITDEQRKKLNIPTFEVDSKQTPIFHHMNSSGVLIVGIKSESVASKTKLQAGDVILSVNNKFLKNKEEATKVFQSLNIDLDIELLVLEKKNEYKKPKIINIKLQKQQ